MSSWCVLSVFTLYPCLLSSLFSSQRTRRILSDGWRFSIIVPFFFIFLSLFSIFDEFVVIIILTLNVKSIINANLCSSRDED